MKTISLSPLAHIHKKGFFGDYEKKHDESLIKISEIKNLSIVQIVQYKNSSVLPKDLIIEGLNLNTEILSVNSNNDTRILWCGPKNWLLISSKKELLNSINEKFKESDFAITDLSHSKTIIQIEGKNSKEILKKGSPFNFNELVKNKCVNTLYNGISVTVDMIDENPEKIRLFVLRSFGESFYHSITDSSLEFGYKNI
jgi:heterotetrameric sarcosine oxidase gamma subunit